MKLIYEKSQPGRRASTVCRPEGLPEPHVPEELRRQDTPRLPEVPEFELMRDRKSTRLNSSHRL